MKKGKSRLVRIGLQVLLGFIFIASAILKSLDVQGFVNNIQSIGVFPVSMAEIASRCFIFFELGLGFFIAAGIWPKSSIITSIVVLLSFEGFMVYSVVFNKEWACDCFGPAFSETISYGTILRDTAFLCLAIWVFFYRSKDFSFDKLSKRASNILSILFFVLCAVLFVDSKPNTIYREHLGMGLFHRYLSQRCVRHHVLLGQRLQLHPPLRWLVTNYERRGD